MYDIVLTDKKTYEIPLEVLNQYASNRAKKHNNKKVVVKKNRYFICSSISILGVRFLVWTTYCPIFATTQLISGIF